MLLPVLLTRDQVEAAPGQTKQIRVEDAGRLIELDSQLRQKVNSSSLKELSNWRQTLQPANTRWWLSSDN